MKNILGLIILSIIFFSACGKKNPPVYQKNSVIIYKQS